MANNQDSLENEGLFPDWIELYNTAATPVSLEGWSLTDDPAKPRKWLFPNSTSLNGRTRLLIYCDGLTNAIGLHAAINLSAEGETLMIFDNLSTNTPHASLTFGPQTADLSIARLPDLTGSFNLAQPTPRKANTTAVTLGSVNSLKINEWLATPVSGSDWFELYNPGASPVALAGLRFSDETNSATLLTNRPVPALSYVGGHGFARLWADSLPQNASHVDFKLSGTGDRILLFATDMTTVIDRVDFGLQATDVALGRLPDGSTNIMILSGQSPGERNFGPITSIVINEVLTHTDPPLEDAIELHNVTSNAVDISHWWLTDDTAEPLKFRIPVGTIIPAGGFKVFYEGVGATIGFNRTGDGVAPSFSFSSSKGDDAWLYAGRPDGTLTGFRCGAVFGPAANGVSFGRHLTSEGVDFAPTIARTFGTDDPASVTQFRTGTGRTNTGPKVGPVVISEIMYQPPAILQGTNLVDNSADEFVELCNTTHIAVVLYDLDYPTNHWRLRGGVTYSFTNDVTLAANGFVVLVNFNPQTNATQLAAFRSLYSVAEGVPIYGPYRGKLNNDSDTLQLERPDPPQTPGSPNAGFVPYVLVEKINYRGSFPWTTNADATGRSLQRLQLQQYGNEPTNWASAFPTVGRANVFAVTHPPRLLDPVPTLGGTVTLSWETFPGGVYRIQHRTDLNSGTWQTRPDLFVATGTTLTASNVPAGDPIRFYRVLLEP